MTLSDGWVDDRQEASELAGIQRRTVWVLSAGQVLGGLGFGATVSLGAVRCLPPTSPVTSRSRGWLRRV